MRGFRLLRAFWKAGLLLFLLGKPLPESLEAAYREGLW